MFDHLLRRWPLYRCRLGDLRCRKFRLRRRSQRDYLFETSLVLLGPPLASAITPATPAAAMLFASGGCPSRRRFRPRRARFGWRMGRARRALIR
ncbi:MAG: hypothetical protein ACREUK_08720, partial [Burkholderiales bacterium]